MSKSVISNSISALIVVIAFSLELPYEAHILSLGLYALSGGITNWLAIHMLFEKVPFLCGSGVIPNRFEEFRTSIKKLIMQQFFSKENLEKFFAEQKSGSVVNIPELAEKVDYDHVFNELVEAIVESPLGGMLSMVGGKEALEPIKEPVKDRMKVIVNNIGADLLQEQAGGTGNVHELIADKIELVVDRRLEELTPEKVKEIVQDIIKSHLGWLVVWGNIFGGAIGLAVSFI